MSGAKRVLALGVTIAALVAAGSAPSSAVPFWKRPPQAKPAPPPAGSPAATAQSGAPASSSAADPASARPSTSSAATRLGGQPPRELPTWPAGDQQGQHQGPAFPKLPDTAEVFQLDNGLQVILLRNPAQPMVGIYTEVRVGSAYEDFRTSGMSHMLEHLLFNGTEQLTQQQLYDLADANGAYNNAHTATWYTDFMLVLPSSAFETGLRMQSQMLFHSLLPAEKFAKEQGVVLGELAQDQDRDNDFAGEAMREVLYQGSSEGLPTIGTRSTIEHMKRDDVLAFYRNFYVPNNMVTMIAGNFDPATVRDLLEKYYGSVAPGTVHTPGILPAVFTDRTRAVVRRGGDRQVLMLAFDAPSYSSPDFLPFLVLERLLTQAGNGILTRALDQLPAARRPELSSSWEKADGFGRLVLRFDLKPGDDPSRYYRLVQDACSAAGQWGLTDDDVLAVVHAEQTQTLLDREQLRELSIASAEQIVLGGPDFFLTFLDQLRDVNAQEVVRVLGSYLVDPICLAVLVLPENAPGAAGGAGGGAGAAGAGAPGAAGGGAGGGAGTAAAAGSPQTKGTGGAVPAVARSVLPCGAVLVTQQNPGASIFAVHLTVRGRSLIDGEHPGAVNLVHRLLGSGVGGCDAACLEQKLQRLGAVIKYVDDPRIPMDNYYTNGRFSYVRLETAADYGPDALALLVDMTTNASFTQADFERERGDEIMLLQRQLGSAGVTANRRLQAVLFGKHPLALPPEGDPASVKTLTYDQVRKVYKQAFAPENLVIAIASPYSHDELAATLNGLFSGKGRPGNGLPPAPITTGSNRVTTSLGSEIAAIRCGSILKVQPEDRHALELLVAVLSNRMAMDLREQKGLSYNVGASLEMLDNEGELEAWLNPPRERMDEGESLLKGFLANFSAATITQDELSKTRQALVGRLMMRRLASISQAYYLAMAELDGDMSEYTKQLSAYDGVTLADLNRVGSRYLRGLQYVTVVVN